MSGSTLPTVKTALKGLLTTALANAGADGGPVPVFYSWQPDVLSDCVFMGRALLDLTDRDEIDIAYDYPTAETNRPCFESYTVPISLWTFRGDLKPEEADQADADFDTLFALLLGVLADVDLGVGVTVNSRPSGATTRRVPYQSGWAIAAITELSVVASLP